MKGKAVVLVLAGVGVMSGMTLSAGATEDLWSYELAADGAGDQVYQFRDVELIQLRKAISSGLGLACIRSGTSHS